MNPEPTPIDLTITELEAMFESLTSGNPATLRTARGDFTIPPTKGNQRRLQKAIFQIRILRVENTYEQ